MEEGGESVTFEVVSVRGSALMKEASAGLVVVVVWGGGWIGAAA